MTRARKLLFGVSLAAMMAAAQPAAADPISGLIVSALSFVGVTTTTAAVTTFLVSTAISSALSYLSQVLSGPKSNFGIKTTLQSGGTVPRAFPIGMAMTPGSEFYPARTWGKFDGTPNAYLTRFIAVSDLPTSLTGFICDDKVCTYGDGTPDSDLGYAIPEFRGGEGKDHLWVKFYDGTQTEADAWAVSQFGSDSDYPYGSDQVGHGVAYALVTARIDKYFFSNIPNYKFILGGVDLYDPTQDTSAGGSGSQRWDTPSTWAVSDLAPVAKYNILRGISYNGQWLYGLQNTHAGCLPYDSWSAAINAAATLIEYKPGVSVSQFRCGGMVSTDTTPADLLNELNKCDNGRLTEAGGRFITRSGAIGAPVMSFTDADLLISEPKQFDQFPGQEETYNGVNATWPDPSQNWTMVDAAALLDSDLEAADGGTRRTLDIQYNFLPYGDQVQGMMKFARDEKRKFRKHTVIAPPRAVVLDPFDAIAWTSAENGYTDKVEEVIPTDQDNLDQGLSLTEGDPADYDWNGETDYRTYTPVPIAGQVVPSQAMVGWSVEPATIYGDDGRAKPGIKVEWGTADIDDVDGVIIEIRLTSSAAIVWSGETPHSIEQFNLGEFIPPANLSADTAYQVRGKYRPISTRDTDWSSWLDVTTPDIRISAQELTDEIQEDLATVLALVPKVDATQRAAAAIRSLQDDVARAATALLQVQLIIPQLSQEFQRQLDASVQALTGSDVTDFAARLFVAESTIIDLQEHKATTTDLRALDSQINTPSTGIAALISDLQETVALLDPFSASAVITQTATAVRGQGIDLDRLGSTVLQILQNLDTLQSGQAATLAYYRREITAQVEQGVSGNAKAVGELGALMKQGLDTVQASVTEEQEARVSETSALAAQNTTLLAAMSGYTAANAVASAFTSTNASVSTLSGTVSGLGSDLSSLGDTVTAQASTISGVSSQVDRVRADGYVSIATQTTPDDALARIALLVSATAGGSTSTAAIFLDALSGGDSRVIVVGSKFYVTDNTHVESLDSVLSFSGGVLTVPAARITGTLDVGSLIADNAIVGGQIVTGNTCKSYVAAQSGTVTASATVKTEILRKSGVSLGGTIQILATFAQVGKADSGGYGNCPWELHHFSPGLSIGGGVIASGDYWGNDSGELHRTAMGNFSGVYTNGSGFDIVLFITGDGAHRPVIGKSQMQIFAFR